MSKRSADAFWTWKPGRPALEVPPEQLAVIRRYAQKMIIAAAWRHRGEVYAPGEHDPSGVNDAG